MVAPLKSGGFEPTGLTEVYGHILKLVTIFNGFHFNEVSLIIKPFTFAASSIFECFGNFRS